MWRRIVLIRFLTKMTRHVRDNPIALPTITGLTQRLKITDIIRPPLSQRNNMVDRQILLRSTNSAGILVTLEDIGSDSIRKWDTGCFLWFHSLRSEAI
jgi:hypothetical protein